MKQNNTTNNKGNMGFFENNEFPAKEDNPNFKGGQEMDDLFSTVVTDIRQSEVPQSFMFNGNPVRVTKDQNGEPWFVAKDIADVLGYSETNRMTSRLDDDETMSTKLVGMNMNSTIINESGLYNAILGSNKPEAKAFKKWVTSEVLPSIRKNGGYMMIRSGETMEELALRTITILKDAVARQKAQIEAQDAQLKIQAPDVEYCHTVLASSSLMPVNAIAAHIGVSAKRLNAFLDGEGWIYKQGNTWYPSCKIRNSGYCDYETVPYVNHEGEQCTKRNLKWTETGRRAVIDFWNKRHNIQNA